MNFEERERERIMKILYANLTSTYNGILTLTADY